MELAAETAPAGEISAERQEPEARRPVAMEPVAMEPAAMEPAAMEPAETLSPHSYRTVASTLTTSVAMERRLVAG
jgi:hypothetical protein